MKCYYYAAAVTSHFVTHTHTHTHTSSDYGLHTRLHRIAVKCSDVPGETYSLHLSSYWISFGIQYIFPNGKFNHYKPPRRPSFYQKPPWKSDNLYTILCSKLFFGWLTVSVARPERQFPLNRPWTCFTFKVNVTCTLHSGVGCRNQ